MLLGIKKLHLHSTTKNWVKCPYLSFCAIQIEMVIKLVAGKSTNTYVHIKTLKNLPTGIWILRYVLIDFAAPNYMLRYTFIYLYSCRKKYLYF